ncbi:MAG TPA: cytochrome c3 family protein [Ramlibacter sp.]|nr:cytochrome c3 family protein [Ramlibacter sp.]
MTRSRNSGGTLVPRRNRALLGAVVAVAFSLLGLAAQAAAPKDTALSKEDQVCLDCHAKPGLVKTLANGQKLSLVVPARGFAQSVHNSSGCEGCHSDIDLKSHEKEPKSIASKRAFALEQMETCRDCHKKTAKQYDDSVHSALVRTGSDKAPLCADCHDPHATRSAKEKPAGNAEPVTCQKCHQSITTAYAESVHGRSGDEALACKDCHQTHNVKAAALGDHMRSQCVSCHRDVATTHAQWLPNTERHLEAISCPACHSPGTTRRVNLRLYEGNAPQAEKVGVPKFVKLTNWADATATGLDARALWSLLQEFNNNGAERRTVLRGRLEVQTGAQAHQLGEKSLALKDCDTCHRQGAASFQAVTVSMAGPDGRPLRHDASKGMLNSIESVGSVGGFYAIGSTRIKLLDTLLVMALAVGILIPLAHLTVKLLTGRRRAHAAHAAAPAASSENSESAADEPRAGDDTRR